MKILKNLLKKNKNKEYSLYRIEKKVNGRITMTELYEYHYRNDEAIGKNFVNFERFYHNAKNDETISDDYFNELIKMASDIIKYPVIETKDDE